MTRITDDILKEQHTKSAITERIAQANSHNYLGDFVLGAVDGTITTFSIVCGVAGTKIEGGIMVAFILGVANVLADGLSMAVSNYLKAKSDIQLLDRRRALEEMHIDRVPEGEKQEIREIFKAKGFGEELLEDVVTAITRDRKLWVDTMLTEEWGLQLSPPSPTKAGAITFVAFVLAGMVPILPLLLGLGNHASSSDIFLLSTLFTGATFLITGFFRGQVIGEGRLKSALETLAVGAIAAAIAYFVGEVLGGLLEV